MKEWLNEMKVAGNISAEDIEEYNRLEAQRPTYLPLVYHQLECLEKLGYGIAPDPRYVFWVKSTKKPVYLYRQRPKTKYIGFVARDTIQTILQMALAVTVSDFKIKPSSTDRQEIDKKLEFWFVPEKFKMGSNGYHLNWLLRNPPSKKLIPEIIEALDRNYLDQFMSDIFSYARLNGFIDRRKLRMLEWIYEEAGCIPQRMPYDLRLAEFVPIDKNKPNHQKKLSKRIVNLIREKGSGEEAGKVGRYKATVEYSEDESIGHLLIDQLNERDRKEKTKYLKWIPSDSYVKIAGRMIKGMIYVGRYSELGVFDRFYCSSRIDPSQEVAEKSFRKNPSRFLSHPRYHLLNPKHRKTYLDWLETDRVDERYSSNFAKLYLQGLEYRLFVDNPTLSEKREILEEARRVIKFYNLYISYHDNFQEFLDYAVVLTSEKELEPNISGGPLKSLLPTEIEVSRRVALGQSISADWCLSWYVNQPSTQAIPSLDYLQSIFVALFRYVFNKKYPSGYRIKKSKNTLTKVYVSSSREFIQEFEFTLEGKPLPNVQYLVGMKKDMKKIVDEVSTDLMRLTRFYSGGKGSINSLEAMELLPDAIKNEIWASKLNFLSEWHTDGSQGRGCKLSEFCEKIEGRRRAKLTFRQYDDVSQALGDVGYGISPDPRLLTRVPKLDESVLIYPLDQENGQNRQVSQSLLDRIVEIALGVWIWCSSSETRSRVQLVVYQYIGSLSNLSEGDRKILQIHSHWFLSESADITFVRKWLNALTMERKAEIRQSSLSMAKGYGQAYPRLIQRLEKLYSLLGYEAEQVYSDLAAGKAIDGPVSVRNATVGPKGEPIPITPNDHRTVDLDEDRINELIDDTEKVRTVLGGVFIESRSSENQSAKEGSADLGVFSGLDHTHVTLVVEFLSKEHWTVKGVEKLATKHGLMWQGSLEVINEWSFELFEEELIEEYTGYRPNPRTAEKFKDLLQQVDQLPPSSPS